MDILTGLLEIYSKGYTQRAVGEEPKSCLVLFYLACPHLTLPLVVSPVSTIANVPVEEDDTTIKLATCSRELH